ncbi:dihydrofolate reductase family protein [Lentibacillus halodurans]|uniref:dihydrofolate reductase family protein n=1 Tax=Lentibacillus halodurans TaxID=237679 RepID=UPI003CC7ACCA
MQQYLKAGLIDEFQIHIVPFFIGSRIRLFESLDQQMELEKVRVINSDDVTHLKYRVIL